MKRLILTGILLLGLLFAGPLAASAATTGNKLAFTALAQQYRNEPGIEITDLGRVALSLMRAAARTAASSPAEKETLAAFSGITRLLVIDCEDSPEATRQRFNDQVRKLLKKQEPLLEARDQGDLLRIYGTLSADGQEIRDVIIFNESDGGLVCAFGGVPISFVERIRRKAR